MSAKKYSILTIAILAVLIAAIKYVGPRTAKGTTKAVNQSQIFSGQLSSAQQELESATAGVVSVMVELQEQLDELEQRADAGQDGAVRGGLLASILYSAKNSSVVIDGVILHEGDMICGVKVVKIHEDTVELEKEGQKWQQKLGMRFPAKSDAV
jgi:hypothetical protein